MVATRFGCPACHVALQLGALPPGRSRVQCPQCRSLFDVVGASAPEAPVDAHHAATQFPPPPSTRRIKARTTETAPQAPSAGVSSRRMPQPIPTPTRPSGRDSRRMPQPIPTVTPASLRQRHAAERQALDADSDSEVELATPVKATKGGGGNPRPCRKRSGNQAGLIVGVVSGSVLLLICVVGLVLWLAGADAGTPAGTSRDPRAPSRRMESQRGQGSSRQRGPADSRPLEPTRRPRAPHEF